jgi:hypothetical protein
MGRGIYIRTKPHGFLHPQHIHTVSVEGIGTIYTGHNKRDAEFAVKRWQKFSEASVGRAAGKAVIHTITKDTRK